MSIRIGCSDVVNGLNKSNSGTDISRTSTAEAMEAEDSTTVKFDFVHYKKATLE